MARLLIVDNDERIVELSAWFMRRLGHDVDTANSYAAARLLLQNTWPDLMLADLDLGYERGQEELPKLANEGLLPATLVVSGFLDASLESSLRRIPGVLGTVAKPVDLKHLEQLICHHLERGERVPAPVSPSEVAATDCDGVEEDGDGWVEIAPLAPGIDPAPPAETSPWVDAGEGWADAGARVPAPKGAARDQTDRSGESKESKTRPFRREPSGQSCGGGSPGESIRGEQAARSGARTGSSQEFGSAGAVHPGRRSTDRNEPDGGQSDSGPGQREAASPPATGGPTRQTWR